MERSSRKSFHRRQLRQMNGGDWHCVVCHKCNQIIIEKPDMRWTGKLIRVLKPFHKRCR